MATQIGHAELFADSESILDRVIDAIARPHMIDVIGGNAGAVPALLAMAREPGLDRCAALAMLLGEELTQVDPATSGVSGRGWDQPRGLELDESTPSGLSHGASGLGLALLELFAVTGRIEFRNAARRSFEYEDMLFHQGFKLLLPLMKNQTTRRTKTRNAAPLVAIALFLEPSSLSITLCSGTPARIRLPICLHPRVSLYA